MNNQYSFPQVGAPLLNQIDEHTGDQVLGEPGNQIAIPDSLQDLGDTSAFSFPEPTSLFDPDTTQPSDDQQRPTINAHPSIRTVVSSTSVPLSQTPSFNQDFSLSPSNIKDGQSSLMRSFSQKSVKENIIQEPQSINRLSSPPHSLPLNNNPEQIHLPQLQIPSSATQTRFFSSQEPDSVVSNTNQSINNEFAKEVRQQLATDWKDPSEYALHILFTKFVRYAEAMLNYCLNFSSEEEPPIVDILGEGCNADFDKVINSLGYISRSNLKPVIDAMMFWRKSKSQTASEASAKLEQLVKAYDTLYKNALSSRSVSGGQSGEPHRQKSVNSSKSNINTLNSQDKSNLDALQAQIERQRETVFVADRKSMISIYILSRVLIEISKQSLPNDTNLSLSTKLEEIVFNQLKSTDPQAVSVSSIRSANWNNFAKLLGWISNKKFISVSDRFLAALEKIPHNLSKEAGMQTYLLILGMKYLKLKNYPLEKFEEGADFVHSIAKFFAKSDKLIIRLAYAEVLTHLLLPLAGSLSAEVNHPVWVQAMNLILSTCAKFVNDSRYWSSFFKLTVSVLCVSPQELFGCKWMSLIERNSVKLKSKSIEDRTNFAVGVSRLVWVYIFRCTESLNNTEKSLKKLFQLFTSTKKKENWLTTDTTLSNAMVDILVTISYNHSSLVVEHILLPLLKTGYTGSLEHLQHEKVLIVINAFKGLLVSKERPEFPIEENREYGVSLDDIFVSPSMPNFPDYEEIATNLNKLFLSLDSVLGSEVWSPENEHVKTPSTPFQSIPALFKNVTTGHADGGGNNNADPGSYFGLHNAHNDGGAKSVNALNTIVFANLIEVIPCCTTVSQNISLKGTIEVLSRNAVHEETMLAEACENAVKSFAAKKNPYTLITWFAKYSFDFDEKTQSSYDLAYLISGEYKQLLLIYIDILECWLESFKKSTNESKKREMGLDGIHLPIKDDDISSSNKSIISEEFECKNICTVIEEVEGNGLFFLCSYDSGIRKLGIHILKLVSRFDEALSMKSSKLEKQKTHSRSSSKLYAESGTRLIDIIGNCEYSKLVSSNVLNKFSAAEKQRLTKLSNKQKQNVFVKLAESEYGVDAALWMRAFPNLLEVIFTRCPITMALCRSIVCIRLVQLHEIILSISSSTSNNQFTQVRPEHIVSQWKVYLIVACCFLTSTNNQVVHFQQAQNHKRKKSQQVFTIQHQKIKSATSIFQMVLPLLGTKNTIIRDAIITGLSAININIYKAFLESTEQLLCSWKFDSKSNTARIELFHILTTCSSYLENPQIYEDKWIMKTVSKFLQYAKAFLHEEEVQCSLTFQPLRLYFSELLLKFYLSVMNIPKRMSSLFPFEARISCFNYLMEWCGNGRYANISAKRYEVMMKSYSGSRDYTSVASSIEFYRTKLEKSSLETMVELCRGPVECTLDKLNKEGHPVKVSLNIDSLMSWIHLLFSSSDSKIQSLGCIALSNVLETNKSNTQLYESVFQQCFFHSVSLNVTELYYTTICKSLLNDTSTKLSINEDDAVTLGLFGIISKKREIRAYAIDLLSTIEMEKHNSSYTKVFRERISNDSRTVYKSTGKEISNIFAELPSQEERLKLFSKLCLVLELLSQDLQGDLLVLLFAWVSKFVLKTPEDPDTYMVLNNTMGITALCNERYPNAVEQLWISLGKGNSFQNFHVIFDFIMKTSYSSRNPRYVETCRDVILYLSNVPGGVSIVDKLLIDLEIKNTLPNNKVLFSEPDAVNLKYGRLINIESRLAYNGKDVFFSKAHLSTIFLVNLLNLSNEAVENKVPLLLHVSLIFLDHYIPIVQESAAKILCDLIYALNSSHELSEQTVALIKDKSELWVYNQLVKEKRGARSPKTMDLIVKNILAIVSGDTRIQEQWQRIACRWGTICAVRHIACRSFQVFRCLITFLDLKMLKAMLHRLSNTICDENSDIQGFAMQILMTFNAVTAELTPDRLIEFPQLFWALAACLSTTHEQEFIEVLSSMSKFVSKIDLDSADTVQCLVATFPSDWEGKFDGLQNIIMSGLRSANSYDLSLEFLNNLNSLKDSKIVANSETRILFALLSNIANFLQSLDDKEFLAKISKDCDSLIVLCEKYNEPALSRLISSLKLGKFRSKKDFLSQVTSFISRNYFPQFAGPTLVFLLGLLFNNTKYVRLQILELLPYIFPLVDLSRPEFIGVGADLICPLLSLLLTDFEHKALEVFTSVPRISGSKIDKDILRISMGNQELREEYSKTATLFGVPDSESGWSVPMPVITASSTRHNVQSVYSTCHIKVNVQTVASSNSPAVEGMAGESSANPVLASEIVTEAKLLEEHNDSKEGVIYSSSLKHAQSGNALHRNEITTITEQIEEEEREEKEEEEEEEEYLFNRNIIREEEEEDEADGDNDNDDDVFDKTNGVHEISGFNGSFSNFGLGINHSNATGLYNIEEYEEENYGETSRMNANSVNINDEYDMDVDDLEEQRRMMILYEYQMSPKPIPIEASIGQEQTKRNDADEVSLFEEEKHKLKSHSYMHGFSFYSNHQSKSEQGDSSKISGKKSKLAKGKSKEKKPKKRSYNLNTLLPYHHSSSEHQSGVNIGGSSKNFKNGASAKLSVEQKDRNKIADESFISTSNTNTNTDPRGFSSETIIPDYKWNNVRAASVSNIKNGTLDHVQDNFNIFNKTTDTFEIEANSSAASLPLVSNPGSRNYEFVQHSAPTTAGSSLETSSPSMFTSLQAHSPNLNQRNVSNGLNGSSLNPLSTSNNKSKNRLSENISVITSPSKANYGANRNSPSNVAFGNKKHSILNPRSSKRNSKAYFGSLSGNVNNSKEFDSPSQPQLQESVSLSHMWTELDNLDNFFTQDNASTSFWST
ncbi:hypothetical protein ACO0QE_001155 [Hanseniaspora vineae]